MNGARQSPLHGRHVASGARLGVFGGWQMPLEYPGGGVVAEHTAVRERVGLFDVSHLGKVQVEGEGARELVDRCLTNDLRRIGAGQAQYTLCCDESGGVVDDLFQYVRADDDLLLVPNAANAAEVVGLLAGAAPSGVTVGDAHEEYAVLAVQGPRSDEVLGAVGLPTGHAYLAFVEAQWRGRPVLVCRTGYTGERGYELLPRWADAPALWDALADAVADCEGMPCGLGARDTLRTEMGYPLHGQDLSRQVTPVQARLGWAVGWSKEAFWGREALLAERAAGPERLSWGLLAAGRGIPRPGCAVRAGGQLVGTVTSGTFSPTLRRGIALALLDRSVNKADGVVVDVRGRDLPATVTRPPFVDRSAR